MVIHMLHIDQVGHITFYFISYFDYENWTHIAYESYCTFGLISYLFWVYITYRYTLYYAYVMSNFNLL